MRALLALLLAAASPRRRRRRAPREAGRGRLRLDPHRAAGALLRLQRAVHRERRGRGRRGRQRLTLASARANLAALRDDHREAGALRREHALARRPRHRQRGLARRVSRAWRFVGARELARGHGGVGEANRQGLPRGRGGLRGRAAQAVAEGTSLSGAASPTRSARLRERRRADRAATSPTGRRSRSSRPRSRSRAASRCSAASARSRSSTSGAGHSRADLVVHLPKEGIVATGDLVVWPVPLVGSTSLPSAFAATLEKLLALRREG